MSVTGAVALIRNTGLIQVSDLDPKRLLLWTGSVVGDATGGSLQGTATVPDGLAVLPLHFGATFNDADQDFEWEVLAEGLRLAVSGVEGFNVAAVSVCGEYRPLAGTIIAEPTITFRCTVTNVDTKIMTPFIYAYAWDLQTARNLPFKFLWPGTLG